MNEYFSSVDMKLLEKAACSPGSNQVVSGGKVNIFTNCCF